MVSEQNIFQEFENLTSEEGFIEVLASIAFKDTFIVVKGETLDNESFIKSYDKTRLSKTELATLIALTIKNYSSNIILSREQLSTKINKTYHLFEELHKSFLKIENLPEQFSNDKFFSSGPMMRESIYYSAEGAFKHQYRDISQIRYKADETWLKQNKGFTISELVSVISIIERIQLQKANLLLNSSIENWDKSFLPIFQFNLQEIAQESQPPLETIQACLNILLSSPKDKGLDSFKSVDDFNYTNACPIIQIDDDYYVFSTQTLWESIYESPFFWFKDTTYNNQASANRGEFTEFFTASRLTTIFGQENVFTNIDIFKGNNKSGEIDVLVVFGKLALIIQAKSKKLTISARKGNSQQIEKDFQAAIEDAYNQALDCCRLIQTQDAIFKTETGDILELSREYKTILPICVVSDHYPALATQARQFLKYEKDEVIKHPFVNDVFFIDTLSEMLPSPLHIFDFLIKRSDYGNFLLLNHELSTLALYIQQNLYFPDEFDMVMLDDNVTCDLELSMMARRDHLKDIPLTPDGLLTRYLDTYVGRLLKQASFSKSYEIQKIGFNILSLDESTINFFNDAIEQMLAKFKKDLMNHDLTLPISASNTGLTIHFNIDNHDIAYPRLKKHVDRRKYSEKAQSWIGFCVNPYTLEISTVIYEDFEWSYSSELQALVSNHKMNNKRNVLRKGGPIVSGIKTTQPIRNTQLKIGRNESCPCGSGSKYKRCCGA